MGVTLEENICSDKDQNREQGIQKARRRGRRLGNLLVSGAALLILFAGNEKVPDNIAGTAFCTAGTEGRWPMWTGTENCMR